MNSNSAESMVSLRRVQRLEDLLTEITDGSQLYVAIPAAPEIKRDSEWYCSVCGCRAKWYGDIEHTDECFVSRVKQALKHYEQQAMSGDTK